MPKKGKGSSLKVDAQIKRSPAVDESEHHYRLLIDHSPNVIMKLDRHGTILFINHTLPEYTVEGVLGTHISNYMSPEDTSRYLLLVEKIFESGEPQTLEVGATGPTCWLTRMFPVHHEGKIESVLIIGTDITEQKRTEWALTESNELNQRIVEAVSAGIIQVEANGAISRANEEAQRILGLRFDQLANLYVTDFENKTTWEDGTPCEVSDYPVSKCLATGQSQPGITLGVRRPDGEIAWGIFSAIPLKDPKSGKLSGAVVTFLDISDRKKGEEELKNSRQQLRDLSTRLQTMLEEERTRISREIHDELGQQLTILKMELSFVNKRLPKTQQSLRKRIESMTELVDTTIQTVRKISTEMRPGMLDDLGLTAAMEWQVEEFKNRTGIRSFFTAHPEEITLDSGRSTTLFRIFQETLTNIVRHSNADEIKIDMEKKEDHVTLKVSDNGMGITQEQIANSKSLGLLGIRERVLLWGGTLQILGTPGEGTTLIVKIPLALPEGAAKVDPSGS
jgi:PAS domain S-box-containing protein